MTAILGGLAAAILWATSNMVSSRSARIIGEFSTLGWMMLIGLVVTLPLAASEQIPAIDTATWLWLLGSALGTVVGLAFLYRGLRVGKVGVVTALGSTEGAIAAVVSVLRGESVSVLVLAMLAVIVAGIVTVGFSSRPDTAAPEGVGSVLDEPGVAAADAAMADAAAAPAVRAADHSAAHSAALDEGRAVAYGVAAAACFGLAIYSTGQAGQFVPPFVAVLPARLAGVVGVLIPLALLGRLRMERRAIPMVTVIALGEVFGNAAYVVGARESLAIAAVLASQYGAVAAVAAFFAFGERLSRGQRLGIVAIASGVAILSAVRA